MGCARGERKSDYAKCRDEVTRQLSDVEMAEAMKRVAAYRGQ